MKKVCPVLAASVVLYSEKQLRRFSNGKAISDGRVAKLEAGCTASTTVYVQAKSGSGWTTKASGSGGREASASCTAQKGTEYRAYAVATIYDSEGNKVDTVKSYSSSSVYLPAE